MRGNIGAFSKITELDQLVGFSVVVHKREHLKVHRIDVWRIIIIFIQFLFYKTLNIFVPSDHVRILWGTNFTLTIERNFVTDQV